MKTRFLIGTAAAALTLPASGFAQSTGTVDFDTQTIVVTGTRGERAVGGVQTPDSSKAKGALTQEIIARQTPGNSILNTINLLPGVSFQNNDPFGSAGGTLNIRGFDASRISLTFDGIPLNDTGNYALYSNQQLDPELIENVTVNYGSTDVDTPSAAASGSTVNYRSRKPSDHLGAQLVASGGDYQFRRVFGFLDTGIFTSFGTKAWISASRSVNNWFANDFGRIDKNQYNAKIYQPIGDNGDFISIAGNYNVNRNNFAGSVPLRTDGSTTYSTTLVGGVPTLTATGTRTVGTGSGNRFPLGFDELPYKVPLCNTSPARAGLADSANACGTSYDERYNPSNTGSVRINSRFTLAPGLVLTVDPSFQYVKANGGGTVTGLESGGTLSGNRAPGVPFYGVLNTGTNTGNTGSPAGFGYYTGVDLNGDGDKLDSVTLLAPSQTQTNRYGVLASLRYDVSPGQTVRLTYSFDRGRHRQTGAAGYIAVNGVPYDVFPVNSPIRDASGAVLQKRDRLSFATLNQVSGEYRGEFFDKKLITTLGVRAPFYQRDLNNNCFTVSPSGNVACTSQVAPYAAANPYNYTAATNVVTGFAPPQSRTYKYNRVLPNLGIVYKSSNNWSVFANYSKGLSVPGTDSLYQAFYFPRSTNAANPVPETTDNFDAGVRYSSSTIQAEVGPWYTKFTNRLASAFDPDTQQTVYRNLGRVDKYGIDGSIAYRPIPQVLVYVFGSYLKSEIKSDVQVGTCTTTTTSNCTAIGQPIYAATTGKRESGAATYTAGARVQATLGPLELGLQGKRTGRRYLNDQNVPVIGCTATFVNTVCPATANTYPGYGAFAPAYTLFEADARLSLKSLGLNDKTYLQVNVQNLFNTYYVGGFSGGSTLPNTIPFAQVAFPRTVIATLSVGF